MNDVWLVLECRAAETHHVCKIIKQERQPKDYFTQTAIPGTSLHFCIQSFPDWDEAARILFLRGSNVSRNDNTFYVSAMFVSEICKAVAYVNKRKNVVDAFGLFGLGAAAVKIL